MAYDTTKDREIKTWKHEDGLFVSLFQYNGGEPKVQIGPRSYTKADGSEGFGKTGRLTMKEFAWMLSLKDEIKAVAQNARAK
jgi:hypothetical protein